ncbi:hypothetical protein PMAYCL1PPCAC_13304, partial [Pristionchus mayeri]
ISLPTFSLFITPPFASSKYSAPNSSRIACQAGSPGWTTVTKKVLPLRSCCSAAGLLRKADCERTVANLSNCKPIDNQYTVTTNYQILSPTSLTVKVRVADDERAALLPLSLQQFLHRGGHALRHSTGSDAPTEQRGGGRRRQTQTCR